MYTNKKKISDGYRPTSQVPLDDRLIKTDLADLASLGTGNEKAYQYYEGMTTFVLSENAWYKWVEYTAGDGPIGGFTYPAGIVSAGIIYSNREFDFVEVNLSAGSIIEGTYADISTLLAGSLLIADATYKITDRADNGILIKAASSNSFHLEGSGIFLNPDFQGVGDYTGIPLFNLNQGVWYAGLEGSLSFADVVFWNGYHYKMIDSGELTGTAPDLTPLAYTILPKATANVGYIEEVDFILYDFANDSITRRIDKRNNDVQLTSISVFQWGNNSVARNTLINEGYYNCINNRGTIQNNTLTDNVTVTSDNTNEGSISSSIFSGSSTYTANFSGVGRLKKCTLSPSYYVTIVFKPTVDHDGKTFNGLGSTFEAELDMTPGDDYDAGTDTLTIPTALNYVGIFNLIDCAGQQILKIANLPTHKSRFIVSTNLDTVLFNHTAIGVAAANDLISDAAAINTITGRTNGSDFIEYERAGNLNRRYNAVIAA